MAAGMADGTATPGGMTPYDSNSPMWDQTFQCDAVAFSPLAQSGGKDPANFATYLPGFGASPFGAGTGSQSPGNVLHQYSPSSPGYSPTSPFAPTSPLVLRQPRLTERHHLRHPRTLIGHSNSGTSPAYSPISPILNLTVARLLPHVASFLPYQLLANVAIFPPPPQVHDTAPSLRHSALPPLVIPQRAPRSVQRRGTRPQAPHSALHPRAVSCVHLLLER
jgi:DNA-directed RNA polymerase II subunit RPB1